LLNSRLLWRFLTLRWFPSVLTGACVQQPPSLRNATVKILGYKVGTMLNCDCRRGFRRDPSSWPYVICVGDSSRSFWENKCQCVPTSKCLRAIPVKQVTPRPEEHKERKTTETQGHMQPTNQANLPGHCGEPPPWEHASLKRIYHFMEGQTAQYQCLPGLRDGSAQNDSAQSVCEPDSKDVTRWTRPKLKCRSEQENGSFSGGERPPGSPRCSLGWPALGDFSGTHTHTHTHATPVEAFCYFHCYFYNRKPLPSDPQS
uniref:Interleukin-2 receptor subunit alpha n=1 Tax=Catagonus wagneri TaxID=51154 RepID=A0A8C3YPX8_9CETA